MPFPSFPSLPTADAFCILLAGGQGTRFHELTLSECKPAMPFAGGKLVDFTLANAMRSGLPQLLVATQYQPAGLTRHLQIEWLHQFPNGIETRDGYGLRPEGYRGTADAVRANLAEIAASCAEEILVLSADHVCQMDYRAMLESHRASGATIPDGLVIGADPDDDLRWFRVTRDGTVLVTAAMLDRYREERPRLHLVPPLPFLSTRSS